MTVDGYTQPGASANTNPVGQGLNTVMKIELDGTNAGAAANGLHITAGNSTVRGLVINRFDTGMFNAGINLTMNGGNLIEGNFIGTDVRGIVALGNSGAGVRITSPSNVVGGITAAAGNVVSGNGFNGVFITFVALGGNVVQGNFLGTDATGTIALGNSFEGVRIVNSPNNTVGGTTPGARNIISGNQNGVSILGGQSAGNVVLGNFIGTDVTGLAAVGNSSRGVYVDGSNNTLGGTIAGARNVISGNGSDGVIIAGVFLTGDPVPGGATGNVVQGNFIGINVTGTAPLGNSSDGVLVDSASNNTIGGATPTARNVISANGGGVVIEGPSTGNLVQGNYIGTDATGTVDLGNTFIGLVLDDAPNNTIGGTTAGAGNVISANGFDGVRIVPSESTGNLVHGNVIGTDVTGTADLGNSGYGVLIGLRAIRGAPNNTIGGTTAGAGNVISANGFDGVGIFHSDSTGNLVQGNFIGTDVTGTAALGNTVGVLIDEGSGNIIGGTISGSGNVISSNNRNGIMISGSGATENLVQANFIGTDVTGTLDTGNALNGVEIFQAPNNTVGGTTTAARNVISGNSVNGVFINGPAATGNLVRGNFIGTNISGTAALGNLNGVHIFNGSSNTIGGMTADARNVISGNNQYGVSIFGDGPVSAAGNVVQGNFIGTDGTGAVALGNSSHGVFIGTALFNQASDNTIGGTASGAANTIAFNGGDGVSVVTGTATPSCPIPSSPTLASASTWAAMARPPTTPAISTPDPTTYRTSPC